MLEMAICVVFFFIGPCSIPRRSGPTVMIIPEDTVFPAILIYRLIAFWMPIPFGVASFFQLRKRVHEWEETGLPVDRLATIKSKVLATPIDSERI